MSYYLKIFTRRESYSHWFCTDSFTIENNTCLDIDSDNDLSIRYPGRTYLITYSKIRDRFDRKYIFYNGNKIIYSLEIDFSENITKYRPEFERILEQIKVQMEQEKVKNLLDKI